jgi:hypothetical protein
MTAELPDGFDPDTQSQLRDKLGESWADQLALKWGTEWPVPCGQELERSLGYGWENQPPDIKSQTVLQLIAAPAEDSAPPEEDGRDDRHADSHSAEVPAEAPAYDEHAWQEYITQNGRQWDGTAATWDQFSEWFAYYAGERGFAAPAAALLRYLASQPATERTATLWPAGEPGSAEPGSVAEPESPGKPEASPEDIEAIMRELLEENPEFADLAEEIRREIVIEAINETLAEEA